MSISSPTTIKPILGQEPSYPGRQNRLYNTMIDVALVYGIDETTCRGLDMQEKGSVQEVYSSLLEKDIKLRFLQILAPGQVFPRRTNKTAPLSGYDVDGDTPHTSIHQRRKFRIEDVGLVWETVDTLHMFMYPDGVQLYHESIEPSMLPLMLTNIEANRSYAVGLKFTRPFFIVPDDDGQYKLIPWTFSGGPTSQCKLIYLPTCVVLVSPHPLYNFMKEALSGLYRLINVVDRDIDFWEILQNFAEKIFLLPTIPEGTMGLEVKLPGFISASKVMPPRQKLYLDVRLDFPFRFLSVEDVLVVVAAILSEQRILVFSSHYSVPGIFIQCILSYIQPFEFRHPIVSILPKDQLELLGAVGTNIMGCHSNALDTPEFAEVEEGVLIYLDEGRVECRLSPDIPLYPLPVTVTERFKSQYGKLKKAMQYDIESLERLTLESAKERENVQFYFHHYFDTKLLDLFLELMVRLFSDITDKLKESRAVFDCHIKKLSDIDQLFYKQVTQTDMFSVFLIQQRNRQRDSFNILADQIKLNCKKGTTMLDDDPLDYPKDRRPSMRNLTTSGRTNVLRSSFFRSTVISSSSISDERRTPPMAACLHGKTNFYQSLQFLEMPQFEEESFDRSKYINDTLEVLKYLSQDKDNKPVCTYLAAYYKIAKGDVMEGLDEFYETLQRLSTSLVPPASNMVEFVALLNAEERNIVQEKTYYKQFLPTRGVSRSTGRHMTQIGLSRPVTAGGRVLKRRPMNNNTFLTEVQQECIARDAESANNLFSVLQTVGQSATIPPEYFQQFVDSWSQVLNDNEKLQSEVHLNPPSNNVPERILTSMSDLKCSFTQHCTVVLTTHRLIILSQAGWRERTFANLHELELGSFSKWDVALHILGGKTPAIRQEMSSDSKRESNGPNILSITSRVKRNSKNDHYLAFSDELVREVWYHIIKEVISGWKIIFNRRDPAIMDEVECHVKMAMALYGTGWMHTHSSNANSKMLLKLLSFHSKPISDTANSAESVGALQYRINPNIHQTEKATIESTLFVPSEICGGWGKLILGMGSGMLRVYDMEARCFESDLKLIDSRRRVAARITCLLLVDNYVWVGRLGKTIHILDVETLCQVSQLPYLDDDPRDMCLSKSEPKIVWTLLLNGSIFGFDPDTRERVAKIQVPGIDQRSVCSCFTVWREYLWIGTNKGVISILNTQKKTFEDPIKFPVSDKDKVQIEIKCLALSSEDEIWCSIYAVPRGPDSMYVAVFNPRLKSNTRQLFHYAHPDRISFILPFRNTVWCGTKSGKILVFSARTENNRNGPITLSAHDDKIRSMAATDTDFVISGTGSNDGYANVWKLKDDWFKL